MACNETMTTTGTPERISKIRLQGYRDLSIKCSTLVTTGSMPCGKGVSLSQRRPITLMGLQIRRAGKWLPEGEREGGYTEERRLYTVKSK